MIQKKEVKTEEHRSWTEACTVEVKDCERVGDTQLQAPVTKLVKGKWYEFRVLAINRIGISDPSESSSPHLCKNKDGAYRHGYY